MVILKVIAFLLVLLPSLVLANGIDDNCPQFVYKTAPKSNADQYLCYSQFAVAYSYTTKTSQYAVEYLEGSDVGDSPRVDTFRVDRDIPEEYSAKLSDYEGTTIECRGLSCDRGHLVPNKNLSSCAECADESFFLTNIVPQNSKNNRVIWRYLENKVRKYALQVNPVYVITGTIYTSTFYNILGNGVAIPDKLYKIIINAKTGESIAFMMDNTHYPVSDLNGKVVPIRVIEDLASVKFDSALSKKTSASYQAWFSPVK